MKKKISVNDYLGRFMKPLEKKDIEEKIKLNLKKMSIKKFRELLYEELRNHERLMLNQRLQMLTGKIQIQNLKEQIKIVEDKIKGA